MTNAIKNYNLIDPSNEIKILKINSTHSRAHSKISEFVNPIFNRIKDLSFRHLGSPTYLVASQEDTVIKKTLKIAGWVFGISPTILITTYLYDVLLDLYRQYFQKYSKLEESFDEKSKNPELLELHLPKEHPCKLENPSGPTIPKKLQYEMPSIPIPAQPEELQNDDFTFDTTTESDLNSELGNNFFEMTDEDSSDISPRYTPKTEREDYFIDLKLAHQEFQKLLKPINKKDTVECSFERINHPSPELLEEMQNTSKAIPNRIDYIRKLWEGAKNLLQNPFNLKMWKIVTPSDSIIHESIEPSYKDFEMLIPITVSHETTAMDTTKFSIDQIKKDLSRMKIFINGTHCLNIQDFVSHLNLTLNTDETDIFPGDNPVIRKILHFSHQGLLCKAQGAIQTHVMQYPDKFPAQVTNRKDRPLAIHINWNAEFPEETEITGEISYHVKSMIDGSILPYIYTVKTKCSLDKEEISWEAVEDIPVELPRSLEELTQPQENEIESPFEMIDSSEATEETNESDDSFTMLESPIITESDNESFEDLEIPDNIEDNTNNNRDIAFDHLLNKTNSCLNSTVTSEYLNSLKIKYPNFVFDDRLMFPVSITTDEIANSLNNLKNNNSNQLIFLPFLVNGWSVDHAVAAVINLSNGTIEYFDPKGQSWFTTRTEKQSEKNVFDFLTELGQKVISSTFSKDKILHNKKNIPQGFSDNINCGAFCLQFIEERITRSFDSIEDDMAIDPIKLRRQLANKLIQNTYSNLV